MEPSLSHSLGPSPSPPAHAPGGPAGGADRAGTHCDRAPAITLLACVDAAVSPGAANGARTTLVMPSLTGWRRSRDRLCRRLPLNRPVCDEHRNRATPPELYC